MDYFYLHLLQGFIIAGAFIRSLSTPSKKCRECDETIWKLLQEIDEREKKEKEDAEEKKTTD